MCTIGAGNLSWHNRSGPIKFYNRGEPYYEFTNFYEAVVKIDGEDWLTTEHYFQAQKFVGTPLVGAIRMLSRPREAFDKSRDPRYSNWRRSDWESVKEDVMYKALQAKFSQHKELHQLLMKTGDRELIEHSPYDSYWGDGGNGTGKNRLGELLMRLRSEMKAKSLVQPPSPPHSMYSEHQQPLVQESSSWSSMTHRPMQHDGDLTRQPSGPNSAQPNVCSPHEKCPLSDPDHDPTNVGTGSQPLPTTHHVTLTSPPATASATAPSTSVGQQTQPESPKVITSLAMYTSAASFSPQHRVNNLPSSKDTPQQPSNKPDDHDLLGAYGLAGRRTLGSNQLQAELTRKPLPSYSGQPLPPPGYPQRVNTAPGMVPPPVSAAQTDQNHTASGVRSLTTTDLVCPAVQTNNDLQQPPIVTQPQDIEMNRAQTEPQNQLGGQEPMDTSD